MSRPQAYRGQALGLPADGPGSLATTGARIGAFVVDAVVSALVAGLFVHSSGGTGNALADRLPGTWSLIPLAVDYVVGTLVAGGTLGMYLFRLRLVRLPAAPMTLGRLLLRTLLLFLFVPAVVFDRDGRGLHDRVPEMAVIRV